MTTTYETFSPDSINVDSMGESDLLASLILLDMKRGDLWTPGHHDSYHRDRYERDAQIVQKSREVKAKLVSLWKTYS